MKIITFLEVNPKVIKKVPKKPKVTNFNYFGAKLYNLVPSDIKKAENSNIFKELIKKWIWQKIPSYQTCLSKNFCFDQSFIDLYFYL